MKFPTEKYLLRVDSLNIVLEQGRDIWGKMVSNVRKGLCNIKYFSSK